jgi:hypothetical protein
MTSPILPSEKALEAVHRTMRDLLRKQIVEFAFDFSDFEPFFQSLQVESDRALPIVAFSYIDDRLRSLMERAMMQLLEGQVVSSRSSRHLELRVLGSRSRQGCIG